MFPVLEKEVKEDILDQIMFFSSQRRLRITEAYRVQVIDIITSFLSDYEFETPFLIKTPKPPFMIQGIDDVEGSVKLRKGELRRLISTAGDDAFLSTYFYAIFRNVGLLFITYEYIDLYANESVLKGFSDYLEYKKANINYDIA